MEFIITFISGTGLGLLLKDALSGTLNEWGKKWADDYWTEVKRKRKLRYNLGRAIIRLITQNSESLHENPQIEEIISLKQNIYGHNKRVASMLTVYGKVRGMLHKEAKRMLARGGYFTPEDMKMIGRFGEEISVMHEGLTIEAHYLMGNGIWSYRIERLKIGLFGWLMLRKIKNTFTKETLGDLVKNSQAK